MFIYSPCTNPFGIPNWTEVNEWSSADNEYEYFDTNDYEEMISMAQDGWELYEGYGSIDGTGTYQLRRKLHKEEHDTNKEPTCICSSRDLATKGCTCRWKDWKLQQK